MEDIHQVIPSKHKEDVDKVKKCKKNCSAHDTKAECKSFFKEQKIDGRLFKSPVVDYNKIEFALEAD